MERILQRNESFAQGNHLGCMAGILQVLDYHHWHVKKLLPHKRHVGRSRGRRNQSPKVILEDQDLGEVFTNTDAEQLLVKQHDTEPVPASRRLGKSHSKCEENHRNWILSFSLQSWLQRTNPVHHLEPSETSLDDMDSDEKNPAIFPKKSNAAEAVNMSVVSKANRASKAVSDRKTDECNEILEIFKVNKEFFVKMLQDPDACRNRFHGLKNSNIKVKLSKSRSFPAASSKQVRFLTPSTLKHKKNEVWFFLNGDKSMVGTRARKFESPAFQTEQHHTDSIKADEDKAKCVDEKTKVSSPNPLKGLSNNRGWNQVVVCRFREIKQKLKHALKEGRGERISHANVEDGNSIEATEISESLEITVSQESNEIDAWNNELGKGRQRSMRRMASLNESLDRYTRLFDNTFGRDTKYSHSRSLTLSTSEEKVSSHPLKSCRRNLSLPDLDSLSSLLNVAPNDALHSGMLFSTLEHHRANSLELADSHGNSDYSADSTADENEMETSRTCEIPESSGCQEEEASQPSQGSEGLELDNKDFLYVRKILELSTFIHDDEDEDPTWHSLDRPLSPSLFSLCENDDDHHNQLLFDLVNETLGDMNEKSYTYFPRPLSRPMPKGNRLLSDVWTWTNSYLSLRPELDKSLDDVVARDLAKRDGSWMNLEWEREMVALELEDLIFDEMLDQVLCSLD